MDLIAIRRFDGVEPGTPLTLPDRQAQQLINKRLARPADKMAPEHRNQMLPLHQGKSQAAGAVPPSSASPVALVSPQTIANTSGAGGSRRRKVDASSSSIPASAGQASQTSSTPATAPGGTDTSPTSAGSSVANAGPNLNGQLPLTD